MNNGILGDPNGIEAKEPHPCWICNALTKRIDINFEAPLCAEHEEVAWNYFWLDSFRSAHSDADHHGYSV